MIITRFAPSPTGFMHIGHLRTALYSYALARHNKGQFILRIEDTDKKREKQGSIENIINTLKIFNIHFDQGPGIGGANEPYIQSQRLTIYKQKAEELVDKGHAYYCFCSAERLESLRKDQIEKKTQPMYDRKCRVINIKEARERIAKGESYVIRLKVPENRDLKVRDEILGDIKWNTDTVDDQVLLKTDGFPTYHLAVVVDDVLMGVTHITRGFEWLASVPKHLLLFEALGYEVPVMAHLPLILDPKGGKLSKRKGAVSTDEFLKQGYLPEALLNFIMLLGWSPPIKVDYGAKEQELFTLDEFIKIFKLKDLNKANPVFNREKLLWFNQKYIQMRSLDELYSDFIKWLEFYGEDADGKDPALELKIKESGLVYAKKVLALVKTRIKTLLEIPSNISCFYFFKPGKKLNSTKHTKMLSPETIDSILQEYLQELETKAPDLLLWKHENWELFVRGLADKHSLKAGSIFMLLRVLVTQSEFSPPLYETMATIGKTEVVKRIKAYLKA